MNFNIIDNIRPFFWVSHENHNSVCLDANTYKQEIFNSREEDGFEGNGYDWTSLAKVFLDEQKPELKKDIRFDPEAGMFCAYSSNENALKDFIISFKDTCENDQIILDLFSRAELD